MRIKSEQFYRELRIKLFIFLFFIGTLFCSAQEKNKEYNFPGEYNKKTAQGMAIYKNRAFLLNDGGFCRIYDLKENILVSEFNLSSSGSNHANCADFGVEFPKGNRKYPAFYVSQCKGESLCFVESIDEKGSLLIQTIKFESSKVSCNWIVDRKRKFLYSTSMPSRVLDSIGTKEYVITKFKLPSLEKSKIVLTKDDILEQFTIRYPNVQQGGAIKDSYLYLPVGLHEFKGSEKRSDAERAIIIVNLKTKMIERTININSMVKEEPEDVSFYKNNLLLYCGQEGGLTKIALSD